MILISILLLFFNFTVSGLAWNLFDYIENLFYELIATDSSTTYNASITNPKNFTIISWEHENNFGIVKLMKTDPRKFLWHDFDWFEFPSYFKLNGSLKPYNVWATELYKKDVYSDLTSAQQSVAKFHYFQHLPVYKK